nr:hypothetical protein [Sedimentibacter sp.]
MNINLTTPNTALESIFNNPNQVITLDANSLIPPDRSKFGARAFDFENFKLIWLNPIFEAFSKLAIHEAVYDELLLPSIKSYIDANINNVPPLLIIHKDSSLTLEEHVLETRLKKKFIL